MRPISIAVSWADAPLRKFCQRWNENGSFFFWTFLFAHRHSNCNMRAVFIRFFTLNAENVIPEIYLGMVAVYLILLTASLFSIKSLQASSKSKACWSVIVVLVPVLGMFIYSLRCLVRADFKFLKEFGLFSAKTHAKV